MSLNLEAIKARVARATKGPWLIIVETLRPRVLMERISGFGDETVCSFEVRDPPDPNADFICAARTDVPELVAEVERLRAVLKIVAAQTSPDMAMIACAQMAREALDT